MSTKPVLLINGNPVGQVGGEGGSGGHTIIDSSGSSLTQESGLQFADAHVTDDPTNGKTVVENIKEVAPADYDSTTDEGIIVCDDGEDALIGPVSDDYVEVEASSDTYGTLLPKLANEVDFSKIRDNAYISFDGRIYHLTTPSATQLYFEYSITTSNTTLLDTLSIGTYNNYYSSRNGTIQDKASTSVADHTVIRLYYGNKKAVVDLQTTANRCLYDNNTTVKQKIDGLIKSINISATANSSGVIETSLPTSTLVCTWRFGNYLLSPYTSGGVWKFAVCDIDSNTKAIKAIPNATGTLYVHYIDL